MGNGGSSDRRGRVALMQLNPYIFDDGTHSPIEYNPGLPVNQYLLPPSNLLQYDSLPESVLKQINVRGDFYDLNGNFAGVSDGFEGHIEELADEARNDYIRWLHENTEIAEEIDSIVMDKIQEADVLRKDIAETEALGATLGNQISERVKYVNEMQKANFKDDIKQRTTSYGVMI